MFMYCRYCGAEMADNEVICLSCGANNVQPVKKPVWKPVVAVLCVVALLAGLTAAVYFGMNGGLNAEEITVKSSYTGTDSQVLESLDTVVAKAGDFELTNGELQIAYWTMVYDFLSYYGDYAAYVLDLSTPLDQQMFNETMTWEQYFLEMALETWRRYHVLTASAETDGVAMSTELQEHFDGLYEDMEAVLDTYDFDSVADMVVHDYGVGGTYENYEKFMWVYYYGNEYYSYRYDEIELTEPELEAYYTVNEDNFVSAGYSKDDGRIVSVRHILLQPNDDENVTTYTEAEWAACLTQIQALQQQWLNIGAGEDSFASLAAEYSDCGSAANGGLIEDIMPGQMVQSFEDWIMVESREYGDYGIVQSEYGYHLIFFVEGDDIWHVVAQSNLGAEKLEEIIMEEEAAYPMVVEYSKIWLGEVALS